ncbi:MAG: hypothetical protein VYD19_02275 [Myxococcota bacterium]|nr:hypothetical protein [Myxococcota bacterium]
MTSTTQRLSDRAPKWRLSTLFFLFSALPLQGWGQSAAGVESAADRLLEAFAHEPSVGEVQRMALSYAALSPDIFRSMRSRSRIQALLPQLTVRVTQDTDERGQSLTRFSEDNRAQDISATDVLDEGLQLYGEARWRLGETVFNFQETAVMRENRYSAKERQRLLQTVTQLYFERRRLQLERLDERPATPREAALARLKEAQITAELDALTDGEFSRRVARGAAAGEQGK